MKKTIIIVLAAAAMLVVVGAVLKDYVARKIIVSIVNAAGQAAGGFTVTMDRIHFGLITPSIEVNGVKILNPTNFPVRECVDLNRLYVKRASLFSSGTHIPEIDLDLTRVVIIRSKDGSMNMEKLASVESDFLPPGAGHPSASPAGTNTTATPTTAPSAPVRPRPSSDLPLQLFSIGKLRVKVDKVDYYDYSLGSEPMIIPATVNFDHTFENVTDLGDVAEQLQAQLLLGDLMGGTNGIFHAPKSEKPGTGKAVDEQLEKVIDGL